MRDPSTVVERRMPRTHHPPFELEITHLADKGVGVGVGPRGKDVRVRGSVPGSRVLVAITARSKKGFEARRLATIRPAAAHETPRCAVFGLCGGCTLQELGLSAQREAKVAWASQALGPLPNLHPVRGTVGGYGHRNKVELSFGVRRYLSEEDHATGTPIAGRFLGFHAPGRFDRVVDAERCELISERANALLATARRVALAHDAPEPWDARAHTGFWRHLILREGFATGELLVALITAPGDEAWPDQLAEALLATPLPDGKLVGVVWAVNDGVADVARGEVQRTWGSGTLTERLGPLPFRVSPWSFFQTCTEGAEVLYTTVGEALGRGGTLLDLYCGTGTVGLVLAEGFSHIVGVEEVPQAVEDARANAAAFGIPATYIAGRMEDALDVLRQTTGPRRIVVDPPRVGLHPKAAAALAEADADVLVYVACHAPSLGRDRLILEAGGWTLVDTWMVDLFPQTGHIEVVARFERRGPGPV